MRVMVAVDESEESVVAGEVARRLFGSEPDYLAINVSDVPGAVPGVMYGGVVAWPGPWYPVVTSPAEPQVDPADDAEQIAARAAADASLAAEPLGEVGDPVEVIAAAALRFEVDVVVVGSQERSWWSRLLEPSVTKGLLARLDCPVLVVKGGEDRSTARDGAG